MGNIPVGGTDTHKMIISIGADGTPMDVTVSVMGFGQAQDRGYISLNPSDDLNPYSARSFISLDSTTLHLTPGKEQSVTATISLPKNAGSGGRYALITIAEVPTSGQMVATKITVPVMITVSGTTPTTTGTITEVNVGDMVAGQPLSVTTTLKNTGNYHYYNIVNKITIADASGNILADSSTSPSSEAIIPGNTVQFVGDLTVKDLPVGSYKVNSKILFENGKVLDEKSTTYEVKTTYVPPITESNITLTPGSSGTLTSPDGRYSVSFPKGAVLGDAVVTLRAYSKDKLQAAPANAKPGTSCFEIAGLSGLLSKDATVKVKYSADDLTAAGGDASQLKLSYYDAAESAWVILPTKVDTGSTTLTATTNHLSVWAVMVSSSTTSSTTISSTSSVLAPTATATQSPVPLTMILASLAIAGIVVRYHARNRK